MAAGGDSRPEMAVFRFRFRIRTGLYDRFVVGCPAAQLNYLQKACHLRKQEYTMPLLRKQHLMLRRLGYATVLTHHLLPPCCCLSADALRARWCRHFCHLAGAAGKEQVSTHLESLLAACSTCAYSQQRLVG
jgi:hypothetical protein